MWVSLFATVTSLALCFCIAATLMQPRGGERQVGGR
jgi:hypothetical protein